MGKRWHVQRTQRCVLHTPRPSEVEVAEFRMVVHARKDVT